MQYIDFKVQQQTITRTDNYEVVGNSENYLYARFEFCTEWDDIIPTAVFSANNGKHISVLIENGECLVPWEMLRVPEFWVGVFGGDRQTTDTVRVGVKPGVKFNARPGVEPTPTAYELLMNELREGITQVEEHAESVAGNAEEAADSAERAADAAENAEKAKDAALEIVNQASRYPRLSAEQKAQIADLVVAYHNNQSVFTYVFEPGRNIYTDNGCYTDAGKVMTNCALYAQKLWAGVHPNTFKGKQSTFDGTLDKAFDWGIEFLFPNRQAAGVVHATNKTLFNFTKPREDTYEGSYSWNSYYGETSEREDKQIFQGYYYACDMAQELYMRGFEIPMSEVDVGDLLFYKAPHMSDTIHDGMEEMAFRNIVHVGIVTNVSRIGDGKIGISHSMPYVSASQPFAYSNGWATSNFDKAYNAFLTNQIVMVARHPAAFGVPSNLGDKFTVC